jgi:D-3-phosphoglycerate dehydrogenase
MFHILVSDPLHEDGLAILRAAEDVTLSAPGKMARDEVLAAIPEAHALIVRSGTKADRELIEKGVNLRVIGRAGVGVDNVDLETATERGIIVMNAPEATTWAVAEHVFGLALALLRNVPQAHNSLAAGEWARKKYAGYQLRGRTLGIIGYGRIGQAIAHLGLAFGMEVIAYDPIRPPGRDPARPDVELVARLEDLLPRASIITLAATLTGESRSIINAQTIAQMQDGAWIVNAARGALIDEAALLDGLESGKLRGAALDVYAKEPPEGSPLIGRPDVIHTPHLAASTDEAQSLVAVYIAQQVLDALHGVDYKNVVNPAVLERH